MIEVGIYFWTMAVPLLCLMSYGAFPVNLKIQSIIFILFISALPVFSYHYAQVTIERSSPSCQ